MIQNILVGMAVDAAKQTVLGKLRKVGPHPTNIPPADEAELEDIVKRKIEEAMKANPKIENELNQEPWYQSGVAFFGTGGVLWSAGNLLVILGEHGLRFSDYTSADWSTVQVAGPALLAAIGVLYRRFKKGLKPIRLFGLLG